MDDEDYEWIDPVILKFGDEDLVTAFADPDRVQKLVEQGHAVTPNAVLAACYTANAKTLEVLLSAGGDPNSRLPGADRKHAQVEDGWAGTDVTSNIGTDKREWYPLQHAATAPLDAYGANKERRATAMTALLNYKPNLYETFRQPIWRPDPFPFPPEDTTDDDDFHDANETPSSDISDTSEDEYIKSFDVVDGEWQRKPIPECGYGLRSVLHSLLEDGAYIKSILEHPNLDLDLEREDSQGRTLLHSACRNAVGADATLDAVVEDLNQRAKNTPLIAPGETSLFHTLRKRGSNLTAQDCNGRNILHHLFEARTPFPHSWRPPLIQKTLHYVLRHVPTLVNQPDRHGTYPLHVALQRLLGHNVTSIWLKDSPLEPVVQDLLDAGAEPAVRDSRGNTALHYLADNGLAEQWLSEGARTLCRYFCEHRVDVNVRNNNGRSALEILMDDNGKIHDRRWSHQFASKIKPPSLDQIDGEVLDMLDRAGARWTEQDSKGQSLLHFVARLPTKKAAFRTKYLLAKSVDPRLKDSKGRTVAGVAADFGNKIVLELIRRAAT